MAFFGNFSRSGSQRRRDFKILRAVSIYVIISCLWILFSDSLVAVEDPALFQLLSTLKGWFFVAVTATLLYVMMTRTANRIVMTDAAHTVLFNRAADSILIADNAGRFMDVNDNAEELLGYSRKELLKMGFADIVVADDLVKNPLAKRELGQGKSAMVERRYMRKDGTIVPVEINAAALPGERHLAIVRDVAQRKLMEEALLQSEGRSRAIVNAVPDLLFRVSQEGVMLEHWVSEESRLYIPPSEFIGRNIKDVLPPLVALPALEAIQKALSTGKVQSFEYFLILNGQTRFYEDRIVVLSKTEVLSVIRDITDRKTAEEERAKLTAQLQRSQKIESLGTLAAGIAHDFNNILNIIMLNASLLPGKDENSEKSRLRVQAITDATERGAQLVKQLLVFARKSPIRQQSLSLNDFIRTTSRLLEETFPKTVLIAFELEQDLPSVTADPNQLHQVLVNLCVNARDAMPGGGKLTIATRLVPAEEIRSRFQKEVSMDHVAIVVRDNGTGMDEETRSHVFEPFFTTKEIEKGTGLGLAVALGVIQSHNGFIDVESELGVGTEFRVYLPANEEATKAGLQSGREAISRVGKNEVILFVEDEKLALEATVESLSAGGYSVLTAVDPEEGLEMFRTHEKEIALVLSDYGLPKYNGGELFRKLRKVNAKVPLILLTGFLEAGTKERMQEIGVGEIITKPFKPSELVLTIRDVLDRKA